MDKYRKLIAAVLGLVVLFGLKHFEVSLPGASDVVLELVVSALTGFGVYQFSNAPNELG